MGSSFGRSSKRCWVMGSTSEVLSPGLFGHFESEAMPVWRYNSDSEVEVDDGSEEEERHGRLKPYHHFANFTSLPRPTLKHLELTTEQKEGLNFGLEFASATGRITSKFLHPDLLECCIRHARTSPKVGHHPSCGDRLPGCSVLALALLLIALLCFFEAAVAKLRWWPWTWCSRLVAALKCWSTCADPTWDAQETWFLFDWCPGQAVTEPLVLRASSKRTSRTASRKLNCFRFQIWVQNLCP